MSNNNNNNDGRQFAFGRNMVETCGCPAVQAGYEPSLGNKTTDVAEAYDHVVRGLSLPRGSRGVIDEEVAKKAWKEVIEEFEKKARFKRAELALDIAHELGWGGDYELAKEPELWS